MDSETLHLDPTGNLQWFINDFEIIERDEFNLLKQFKTNKITNFEAIQTAVISAAKQDWRFYDSQALEIHQIEELVRTFILNHSSIPYVGKTPLKTKEPIGCIEGEIEDESTKNKVKCKLAYWSNGIVYYIKEENTDKFLYLLAIDEPTAELYNYPESKKGSK